jgi:hypothetical protein
MSESAAIPMPVESVPSVQYGTSALASANAPFVYFENAPMFGHVDGVVRITLAAVRDYPVAGKVGTDIAVVAHLRMSVSAAKSLKAAIDGALLLAAPSPTSQRAN